MSGLSVAAVCSRGEGKLNTCRKLKRPWQIRMVPAHCAEYISRDTAMENPARIPLLLRLGCLAFLTLFCMSFVPCFDVGSSDCCAEEAGNPPACAGGAACHCACAFSGVPQVLAVHSLPVQLESVSVDASIPAVILLTHSLDRPPRLA